MELSFSAHSLPRMDFGLGAKADPYLILFFREAGDAHWRELFRTETCKKTLHPTWTRIWVCANCTEYANGQFKIEVYDYDKKSDDDLVGRDRFTLKQLQAAKSYVCSLVYDGKPRGNVHIAVRSTNQRILRPTPVQPRSPLPTYGPDASNVSHLS